MRLADWIRVRGMTQAQFAEWAEFHPSTVSRWVNGSRIPNQRDMVKLRRVTENEVGPADFYAAPPNSHKSPRQAAGEPTRVILEGDWPISGGNLDEIIITPHHGRP